MKQALFAAALLSLAGAAPLAAGAQTTPGQTVPATQPSAVNANNEAAATVSDQQAAQVASNADAQAQYQQDLASYDAALMRHDAHADRQAARYHHQQRAYADAMAAWRAQVYACHHGSNRACNAPAPDPAQFW